MKNKILKNLKLGLAGIVLASGLGSCVVSHLITLKKYSPLTANQKDSLFNNLNPELKNSLKKVYIINEKDFKNRNVAAHVHGWNGTLCLPENDYDSEISLHEIAHVKHHALRKADSDFSKKWKQVAEFKYKRRNTRHIYSFSLPPFLLDITWKDGTREIKNGCLNPYSAESVYEDVATFVQALAYKVDPRDIAKLDSNRINNLEKKIVEQKSEIDSLLKEKDLLLSKQHLSSRDSIFLELYSIIIDNSYNILEMDSHLINYEKRRPFETANISKSLFPLYFADTTDHRYQKKIDLLREYNFLTNEEHEKLSENLGSLNYLLKEKK